MTTFTIHTDDAMANAIRAGAAEAGQSINVFIKNALGATLGLFKKKVRPLPDFMVIEDPLTHEEAEELLAAQKAFDVIDEEMWK